VASYIQQAKVDAAGEDVDDDRADL